jgi:hypothetical protein
MGPQNLARNKVAATRPASFTIANYLTLKLGDSRPHVIPRKDMQVELGSGLDGRRRPSPHVQKQKPPAFADGFKSCRALLGWAGQECPPHT